MHNTPTANRGSCGSDQTVVKLSPFSSARVSQPGPLSKCASISAPKLLAKPAPESRAVYVDRHAAQTGPRFAVAQSHPARDVVIACACGLVWALFWVLLLSAAFSPGDDVRSGVDVRPAASLSRP